MAGFIKIYDNKSTNQVIDKNLLTAFRHFKERFLTRISTL
ncbi:hypothetical protein CRENPOLYSF1_890008 [Crenothrix polyspora]|uniref:Uncharacterized protein n=1 Tax=Crenothrix polyspora TaxID=360316 RepID=A0A1R4HJC9_9GAMM|nr:hypothetical protein CRENPOLYSF1_890008 [Crenothrix polyspora]